MKKISLCLLFLLFFAKLQALPVGNPYSPHLTYKGLFIPEECWVDLRIGYEGSFVSDRRLEQTIESFGNVDDYRIMTNSAVVTLNLHERIDLFVNFGAIKAKARWRITKPGGGVRIAVDTDDHFDWSVGTNIILYEWGETALGLGGRYLSTNPDINSITVDGAPANPTDGEIRYKEWQINLGISHKIRFLVPYLAVKYSHATAFVSTPFTPYIASDGESENHFKSRNPVGIYLGCSLTTGKYFFINIEGRFIDEEAVTVTADLRF